MFVKNLHFFSNLETLYKVKSMKSRFDHSSTQDVALVRKATIMANDGNSFQILFDYKSVKSVFVDQTLRVKI